MIHIEIEGVPLPQLRHRDSKWGGKYDLCARAKDDFAIKAMALYRLPKPLECPVAVALIFNMPRPKNHFRVDGSVSDKAPYWHIVEPDFDNLTKFVLDALTGFYWVDDKKVFCGFILKRYADSGSPSTEMIICTDLTILFAEIQQNLQFHL